MYRIGEFARIGQVSVKTLRFYDEIGLLRPAWTDPRSGYRYYLAEQAADLNTVLALKGLGLSLDEVAAISRSGLAPEPLRELLLARRAEAERHVREARARVDRIDASLARIDGEPAPLAVAVKCVGPRLVVSRRDEVASFDRLVELFDEVERHTRRHQVRATRGALFHGCAGGALDCEALAFVGGHVPQTDRLRVYEMPAAEVAAVVHVGPLEGAGGAYETLDAWVRDNRLERDGPFLELYLEERAVEIQFPLRAKKAH